MISFLPGGGWLALAGLAAAAGPVLIHLLNRRIFRQIDWAAMEFLLEASRRSKAFLRIRDLVLMALRMAALALFGLAVARPFLTRGGAAAASGPVHAILVLDNSMSMGRERLGGVTLLDDARTRAAEFIEQLPAGSRISVVPLCGSPAGTTLDAYPSKEDALEALAAVPVVDRRGTAAAAEALAARAADAVADLPEKRIVFLGDQQAINWSRRDRDAAEPGAATEAGRPEMQVVSVASADRDNSWVESLRIEDGVADTDSEATLTAVVRHEGAAGRAGVSVSLVVDGAEAATSVIDLEPGQSREIPFRHRFATAVDPGLITSVPVTVTLAADQLPEDDSRSIVVPVVAAVPVVFIDQFGAEGEQPARGRIGETRHLRTLLAPALSRGGREASLVRVRHATADRISRDLLEDARLVVIAGVSRPEPAQVEILREFVAQGGRLVLAAGGDFDPAGWTAAAWLDGAGILPAPLEGTVGRVPDEGRDPLRPFQLDVRSIQDDPLFRLPGVGLDELRDLYELPLFFKAVRTLTDEAAVAAAVALETRADADRRERLAAIDAALERAGGPQPAGDAGDSGAVAEERRQLAPDWLIWARDPSVSPAPAEPQAWPAVQARFVDGLPFLVSRRIGRGEVVWVSTGVFSNWNTLPKTNAMLLFDRLLRGLLAATLPTRTFDTVAAITLPVSAGDRRADVSVTAPDGSVEALGVEAVGGERYGVTLRDACRRGIYTITAAERPAAGGGAPPAADAVRWRLPVAVNGPAEESDPALLDAAGFAATVGDDPRFQWIAPDQPIRLSAARISGQQSWWWLLLAALACLLVEVALLAWPYRRREAVAVTPAAAASPA